MAEHLRDRLHAAEIVTLAERESGAHGLADAALTARVAALVGWINAHAPFSPEQVRQMRAQIQRLLATRLRLVLDRARHPGIAAERIERPVFIIGFARSGTTLLHSLLAEDPEALSPRSWHMFSPSPPPGAGPVVRERFAYADRMMAAFMDYCPAQKPMHPYVDKGAHQPIEDEEVFSLDFHNAYPYHYYHVPVLGPAAVGIGADPGAAYRFHREFLQHLQWKSGATRWVCKGTTAQMNLAALLDVYPDALCVWPHRPLVEIYASNVALRAATYDSIQGRPLDWSSQAREVVGMMKDAFDALLASRLIDDPRILHLRFRDIARDPVAAVGQVHARLGREVTPEHEARIRGWLADPENATNRFGRYPYSYEAFGLDRDWVERLFADYSRRFGLDDAAAHEEA